MGSAASARRSPVAVARHLLAKPDRARNLLALVVLLAGKQHVIRAMVPDRRGALRGGNTTDQRIYGCTWSGEPITGEVIEGFAEKAGSV